MAQPIRLRIILGEDDTRKLILSTGIQDSIKELCQTIKTSFGLQQEFRLQYQDADFGNEFINLTKIFEIVDKATIKVIFLQSCTEEDVMIHQHQAVQVLSDASSISSVDMDNTEPASSSGSSPSSRHWVWPRVFTIPPFSYDAELQLEKAEYNASGVYSSPSLKLKSHILEQLSEEIF